MDKPFIFLKIFLVCLFFATYIVFLSSYLFIQDGKLNCMILVEPRIAGKRPYMTKKKWLTGA